MVTLVTLDIHTAPSENKHVPMRKTFDNFWIVTLHLISYLVARLLLAERDLSSLYGVCM